MLLGLHLGLYWGTLIPIDFEDHLLLVGVEVVTGLLLELRDSTSLMGFELFVGNFLIFIALHTQVSDFLGELNGIR